MSLCRACVGELFDMITWGPSPTGQSRHLLKNSFQENTADRSRSHPATLPWPSKLVFSGYRVVLRACVHRQPPSMPVPTSESVICRTKDEPRCSKIDFGLSQPKGLGWTLAVWRLKCGCSLSALVLEVHQRCKPQQSMSWPSRAPNQSVSS